MPLLDHTKLVGYKQQRLAHMSLTFIGSAYVWQDGDHGVAEVTVLTAYLNAKVVSAKDIYRQHCVCLNSTDCAP